MIESVIKKLTWTILFTALLVTLSGCSIATSENADRIASPVNSEIPLEGSWKLVKCFSDEIETETDKSAEDNLTGEIIGFSNESMVFAGDIINDVSFRIKRVDANEYFLHKNTSIPSHLQLKGNEIFIISAFTDYKFSFEFIKDIDGKIIACIDDRYYYMEKVSENITYARKAATSKERSKNVIEKNMKNSALISGLLLGVRIPVKTVDDLGDYEYRTYWISADDRILKPVYYASDIYLPRKDGFWRVQVRKKLGAEGVEDYLYAAKEQANNANVDLLPETGEPLYSNFSGRLETKLRKAVVYIGNDYVCIENISYSKSKNESRIIATKTLRTLPVDNLNRIEGIKISDLAGENGAMAMENAVAELTEALKSKGLKDVSSDTRDMNFALFRKTGHWFFKGRLNFDAEGELPYMDFNLNLIPPENMVAYDTLQVPWTEVKDKLPQAVDVYTSPVRDLAVVMVQGGILLYAIENGSLSDEPLGKLSIPDGSTVIMAEWCTGKYVDIWEKSFIKNNNTNLAEIKS